MKSFFCLFVLFSFFVGGGWFVFDNRKFCPKVWQVVQHYAAITTVSITARKLSFLKAVLVALPSPDQESPIAPTALLWSTDQQPQHRLGC